MLIGLCGYAGSGKDEAAKALVKLGWQRVAFADAIREMARKIDPLVTMAGGYRLDALVEEVGWEKAKKNPDVRRLLQNIGTAVRDVLGPEHWVETAENAWLDDVYDHAVYTDVRFPNEVHMLRHHGGLIVRIERPGVGPVNGHVSESSIDSISYDRLIVNDGTPEELHAKILALI